VNTASAQEKSTTISQAPALKWASAHADGIEIRCLEAGAGSPLVYLHGGGGFRLSVAHRAFAECHRLVALELPGFGKTPAHASHTSARAIAATIARALESLGIDVCALMGHSVGANIALWLAIDHPALVSSLILVAPTAFRPEASGIGGSLPHEIPAQDAAHLWFGELASSQEQTSMRELARSLSGPGTDPDLAKAMGGLAIPVLALFGTRSSVVSTDAAREYSRSIPKCFTTMVYDAGHDIDLDRPDAVTAVVENFLQHGESFIVNRENAIINP